MKDVIARCEEKKAELDTKYKEFTTVELAGLFVNGSGFFLSSIRINLIFTSSLLFTESIAA